MKKCEAKIIQGTPHMLYRRYINQTGRHVSFNALNLLIWMLHGPRMSIQLIETPVY